MLVGFFSGLLSHTIWFDNNKDLISLLLILITSIFVVIAIFKTAKIKVDGLIVYISYNLMLALLLFDRFIKPLDGSDADSFHLSAVNKSQGIYSSDYGGVYTNIIGSFYKLLGVQRIAAQYLNILLAVSLIIVCYKTFELININKKYKTIGLAMISFSPNFLMLSCVLRRETLVSFLLAVSLYFFILWWIHGLFREFVVSVLICLAASAIHSGAISPIIAYFSILLLYDKKQGAFNFRFKTVFGLLIVVFLFFYLNNKFGSILFGKFQTDKSILELANQAETGRGGSGYSIKGFSTGNEVVDLIFNTPLRVLYFVLSPMPWDWRGINDIIAFCFSSLYYFIGYILAYKALKSKCVHNEYRELIIALFIMMISACIMFAWGVSNAGTAIRHRDKFIAIYVIMCTLCLNYCNSKEKSRGELYG